MKRKRCVYRQHMEYEVEDLRMKKKSYNGGDVDAKDEKGVRVVLVGN